MRRIQLLAVVATTFLLSTTSFAEPASQDEVTAPVPEAGTTEAAELAWDQFDDPTFDPANPIVAEDTSSVSAVVVAEESPIIAVAATHTDGVELSGDAEFATSAGIVLGPKGIDGQGRVGRLHTVATGDTLWDLTAAYLGTPWVWPSVWIDNDDIANPHLILPADKIWITANEMRVVSDAEAESFVETAISSSQAAVVDAPPASDEIGVERGAEDAIQPIAALETEVDDPSTLEAFPVSVVGEESGTMASGRQITISRRDAMGFVSEEDLAGASSIVGSSTERTFLSAGDSVVLGMGEGDVEPGDQFTIFRVVEEVRDVETNRVLGHHVEILGWLEVNDLTGDTSLGEIRVSYSEMRRGVRVMRRPKMGRHVTARPTPEAIEGKVVFLPSERTVMADGGYVYLNRGEFHGVEVGSELEVFDQGAIVNDRSRRVDVRTPDHSVARLVVVSVMSESSVAFILTSSREIEVGDDVRPVFSKMAQR